MKKDVKITTTLVVSLFLIIFLFCGIILVERNVRRIAFNDYSSMMFFVKSDSACQLWIRFMGTKYIFDFKKLAVEFRPDV